MRFFLLLIILISFNSCDYISFKKNPKQEFNDTLDVNKVDVFPSFEVCDSIIDKRKKENCFRTTIHQEITKDLESQNIKVKRPVDEIITVVITIHSDKRITLKSIDASKNLKKEIPNIKELIEGSIAKLPKVFPAIKRDIPVTSEYKLPIQIKLEN